ncbi:hypothetical protein LCGC14_2588340, partial [marine sediment metagenome]
PTTLTSETGAYTIDGAAADSVLVTFEVLGTPNSNIDYHAFGMVGSFTDRYEAAFERVGNSLRFLKYEPDQDNFMNDRSAYDAPTESFSKAIFHPSSYSFPSVDLAAGSQAAWIEQDIRKLYLPPDFHLSRTFSVNQGGYLKRTVWLCEYDGNQYELSQVVPHFIKNEILGSFAFSDLYSKFLDKPSSISQDELKWLDHIAYFTKLIIQLQRYFSLTEDLIYSTLGELFISSIIGNICLLIESTCKLKINSLPNNAQFKHIYQELKRNHYSWNANLHNDDFLEQNLANTLTDIFNNQYRGSTDSLENSFCLSYGLRNKVLHNINSLNILREKFKKIVKKQMEFFIEFAITK